MNYGRHNITRKKKLLNSSAKKLGTKLGITSIKLLLISLVAVIVAVSCLALGSMQGIIASAPDISAIDVTPDGYATKIYDNTGTEIQSLSSSGANRISVKIDKVPNHLQKAFIAVEDSRFYEHNGIDIRGIMRAAVITLKDGGLSQGASTLTQQLLKNNVFNAYNETTMEKIKRKIQEQYLAIKLETLMDKETILENYLNTINLGNGYYGVQAAANGYFGKDVSELSLSECAVIASITQNPAGLNPIKYPEKNKVRQTKVLNDMLEQGYISKEERDTALADDVYSRLQGLAVNEKDSTYSYFVDTIISQVTKDLVEQKGYTETQASNLIYRGGLQIFSTQDMKMQEIADSIINNPSYYPANTKVSISYSLTIRETDKTISYYSHYPLLEWYQKTQGQKNFNLIFNSQEEAQAAVDVFRENMLAAGGTVVSENITYTVQPQMSFTLMDQYTGEVKVLVGGRGEKTANRTLNRATSSERQPGSSIKPLAVYGPALDTGAITLATAIDDAPYYYSANGQLITNHDNAYSGLITVRQAIAQSTNVPAVKILTKITPEVGFNYLQKLNFSTLVSPKKAINGSHDVVQPLALGGMTVGVTCADMTAAYAAIANKGVYTEPIYYTQVLDHDGNVILDNTTPNTTTVFKESTAWLLTSALESVADYGTGAQSHLKKQPTAVKTGTTQNSSDRWICGYTPYYTASAWLGYDDQSESLGGLYAHLLIWKDIMEGIHADLPVKSFEQPDNIVSMTVCDQSGELPVENLCDSDPRGSRVITEYFAIDNKPVDTCQTHIKVKMCDISEEPANVYCYNFTTKIYIKKASVNIQTGNTDSKSDGNKDKINMIPKDSEYALTDEQINKICSLHSWNNPGSSSPQQPTTDSNNQQSDSNNLSGGNNNSSGNNSGGNNSNNGTSGSNDSNNTESSTAAGSRR